MTAPHDIARALAFALGLKDDRITEQVDGLTAEGVLTGGQASEHDAVVVLLCVLASEQSKPDEISTFVRHLADAHLATVTVREDGRLTENHAPGDPGLPNIPNALGDFLAEAYAEYCDTDNVPGERYCAQLTLGRTNGSYYARVLTFPTADTEGGVAYSFSTDSDMSIGPLTNEVSIANPFEILRSASKQGRAGADAVPTHGVDAHVH